MITTALVGIFALALGFGAGRIKNAGKLSAIKTAIGAAEAYTTAEGKALVTAIKVHL